MLYKPQILRFKSGGEKQFLLDISEIFETENMSKCAMICRNKCAATNVLQCPCLKIIILEPRVFP